MRVCITVAYDGTDFYGWQLQKDLPTIQGELENALFKIFGVRAAITGSGRTDKGVHALGQVAHFDVPSGKTIDVKKITGALNFYLPLSIRVISAKKVSDIFSARFSAKSKTYIYKAYLGEHDNPLLLNRAVKLNKNIDINKMKRAAELFVGEHNFSAFKNNGSKVKNDIRKVFKCKLINKNNELILEISANGFLYNMVRNIASIIFLSGENKVELNDIIEYINCKRGHFTVTAPPYALYLKKVKY